MEHEHLRLIVKACLPRKKSIMSSSCSKSIYTLLGCGAYLFIEDRGKPYLRFNISANDGPLVTMAETGGPLCTVDLNDPEALTKIQEEIRKFLGG